MHTTPRRVRMPAPRRQHGVATLLITVMLGLAVTTTVLYTAYALRGTQQRHLTTHAATSAQASAWRGVEIVRLGLVDLANDPQGRQLLDTWADGGNPFQVTGPAPMAGLSSARASGNAWPGAGPVARAQGGGLAVSLPNQPGVQAVLTEVSRLDTAQTYRVRARIAADAGEGSATTRSTVDVVYELGAESDSPPGTDDSAPPFSAAITFIHDLNLSGSITVRTDPGTRYQVNVDGNLTTGGNSITGVDTIWSTGSVRISSGSTFNVLRANGDIRFDGSVRVTESVSARGDICVTGGAAGPTMLANGSIYADGGVRLGDIAAIGRSDRGALADFCAQANQRPGNDVDGQVYAVDLQGNAGARSVRAGGSVRIASGDISQANGLQATGHFVDTNWGGSQSGVVGKTVTVANPDQRALIRSVPGHQVPIAPASPVVLDASAFNAYDMEPQAHYVFKVDRAGYRMVTVRNVQGIADDTYFIADYASGPYKDHLCRALTPGSTAANPVCATPLPATPMPICRGHSEWNRCLFYEVSTRQWRLDGVTLSPGIAWFEGDLNTGNGTYYNTLIATGNITTSGSTRIFALTFAGYAGGSRQEDWNAISFTGICANSHFPGRYPTNWCNPDQRTLTPPAGTTLGHYALLAGSYNAGGQYQGGNISLGSSVNVFGAVLAGNLFSSGGSTTIRGAVTALGQGSVPSHAAGGSTTLDLRGLPTGYTPTPAPCQLTGTCPGATPGDPAMAVRVHWSRYL